ncbi:uncharacterized protein LOC119953008 [Scyliorhinus canicula]|uniref:uncharacterized protein LOC119953008 n=1 Tax=Scyliorhinus canicula TaxID=7830 RepID=UPI0018F36A11|nr:uncharacterized protein LOC119953008 [Scyliorhinus canicula]
MEANRRAAPRFRDSDLDSLLDAVEERRDILYPRGQRYPQSVVRRVWREVGVVLSDAVHSMGHIPRTGEQCRKKLHDLTRAARGKTAHNFQERARTGGGLRQLQPLTDYEQRALDLAVASASREVVTFQNGGPSEHRRGTDCSPRQHEVPTSSSHSVEPDRREGPRAGGPPSEASTPRSDAQRTDRDIRTSDSDSYESMTDGEGTASPDSDAQRTSRHGGTEPRTSCGRNPGGHGSTQETELGTENDRAAAAMLSATPPNIADTVTSVGQLSGEASGTHSGAHHKVELVPKVEVGDAEGLDGRRAGQAQHPAAAQTAPAFLAIPRPPTVPMQFALQGPDDGMTAVFRQLQTQLEEFIRVHKQGELSVMTTTQADITRVASAMEAMGKTASAMGQVLQGVGLSAHASSVAHDRTAPSQAAMLQRPHGHYRRAPGSDPVSAGHR